MHLVSRIFKGLFFIRSPGLKDFLEFYRQDRILPYTTEDKELLPGASRCISCGLCDSFCPAFRIPPSMLPHFSRSIPDFAGNVPLDSLLCEECRGCESVCPMKVPLKKIIQFMREKNRDA